MGAGKWGGGGQQTIRNLTERIYLLDKLSLAQLKKIMIYSELVVHVNVRVHVDKRYDLCSVNNMNNRFDM